jgi:DNA-binding transcriptional ArsR family regulator
MLAARVGLARQKVNYHLKALERHGLVELVEERRKGNVNERMLRATAASYVTFGLFPSLRLVLWAGNGNQTEPSRVEAGRRSREGPGETPALHR